MERTEDPRAPLPAAPGPRPVEQTEPHAGPAAAPDRPPRSGLKALAVSGNLSFIKGNIAIQDEQGTYYIFGLEKLIGFVEGLVEGATVSLEGVAAAVPPEPNAWYFYASKLKIKGREYAGLNAYYPASPPPSILQR
jgi:hypothetical protein